MNNVFLKNPLNHHILFKLFIWISVQSDGSMQGAIGPNSILSACKAAGFVAAATIPALCESTREQICLRERRAAHLTIGRQELLSGPVCRGHGQPDGLRRGRTSQILHRVCASEIDRLLLRVLERRARHTRPRAVRLCIIASAQHCGWVARHTQGLPAPQARGYNYVCACR